MANSKLQVLGGVRVENTDENYNTAAPDQYNYKYGHLTKRSRKNK